TINDEDNECDVTFDAFRDGGGVPTPVRTPTPGGSTNEPGDPTPTTTPGGPTDGSEVTPTPATSSSGPSVTVSVTPRPCPVGVEVLGDAGDARVLDTGWTGIAHDATV